MKNRIPQLLQNPHLHICIKTNDFKPFRIRTYTKQGRGWGIILVNGSLADPARHSNRIPTRKGMYVGVYMSVTAHYFGTNNSASVSKLRRCDYRDSGFCSLASPHAS